VEYVLECEQLAKNYTLGDTTVHALKGVDIRIKKGAFTAIVGPSGSGKSTLLHLAAGLDTPSEGKIRLTGKYINEMNDMELSRVRNEEIGFIFQSFNLIPVLSVYENVEYPCLIYPQNYKNREHIPELLGEIGMWDKKDKRPAQLSGGERQRVAIARALVNAPDVVFADEPTANLDHATGEIILNLMKRMNRKYGTTFIYSTHDPAVMEKADYVIRLRDGEVCKEPSC